ncbi:Uncharacterised protein [Legionella pneumophila]|nr:Uncharacterised protein [Legionella pneumophila]
MTERKKTTVKNKKAPVKKSQLTVFFIDFY